MAPENKEMTGSVVKRALSIRSKLSKKLPGHNLSLGLRAAAEDLGLSAEPHSPVAPPEEGPADILDL